MPLCLFSSDVYTLALQKEDIAQKEYHWYSYSPPFSAENTDSEKEKRTSKQRFKKRTEKNTIWNK